MDWVIGLSENGFSVWENIFYFSSVCGEEQQSWWRDKKTRLLKSGWVNLSSLVWKRLKGELISIFYNLNGNYSEMDVDFLDEKWEDMEREPVVALEEMYVEFQEELPHSEYSCKFWNRLMWRHVSKGHGLVPGVCGSDWLLELMMSKVFSNLNDSMKL